MNFILGLTAGLTAGLIIGAIGYSIFFVGLWISRSKKENKKWKHNQEQPKK